MILASLFARMAPTCTLHHREIPVQTFAWLPIITAQITADVYLYPAAAMVADAEFRQVYFKRNKPTLVSFSTKKITIMKKLQSLGFVLSNQQMKKIVGGYDTCQIICDNGNSSPYSPPNGTTCQDICAAAVLYCNNEGHYVQGCCGGC